MRIIAGKAKGRKLRVPDTRGTRPATDRVREAVFSGIGSWVEEAAVADLYAGSGSYGLEALSRGAVSAVFVENARRALVALRRNVAEVGLGGEVHAVDVADFLRRGSGRFHLVFLDPPWAMPTGSVAEQLVELDRFLLADAEVVISRRSGDPEPVHPENWRVATNKRYGDTRIIRYEKVEHDDDGVVPGQF